MPYRILSALLLSSILLPIAPLHAQGANDGVAAPPPLRTEERIKLLRNASTTIEQRRPNPATTTPPRTTASSTRTLPPLGEARRKAAQDRKVVQQEERIVATAEILARNIGAVVERLSRIADKLDQRLSALHSAGAIVTKPASLLADARKELTKATTELTATQSPNVGTAEARTHFRAARDAIRRGHKKLLEAVAATRAATPRPNEASTTPTEVTPTASTTPI